MPFITPQEIEKKAASTYSRFLRSWIRGEAVDFFPVRLRANLHVDAKNMKHVIASTQQLLDKSKSARGWGYTVNRERSRKRDLGINWFAKSVTIDTLEDLLRLAQKEEEFHNARGVAERIRERLPRLEEWIFSNVASLHLLAASIDGLIAVTEFFLANPRPDCYARQLPIAVDTKFVARNRAVLHQWLDLLLPASAIDFNEVKFQRRFGLRDGRPHRAIRLLDPQLHDELGLPFDELSLPMHWMAKLPIERMTVFIVENDLNLLTLPSRLRSIAIRGEGNAVNRLESLQWLQTNRVIYWGDMDVEGLVILSRLRNIVSHVESIMMDLATLEAHREFVVAGNGAKPPTPTNLTRSESQAFQRCLESNIRLEQEKIIQCFVDSAIVGTL